MEHFLKLFSRSYIHATFFILGAILVLVSIIAKIPGTSGGEIVLRQPVNLLPLVLGICCILAGLLLSFYTGSLPGLENSVPNLSQLPNEQMDSKLHELIAIKLPSASNIEGPEKTVSRQLMENSINQKTAGSLKEQNEALPDALNPKADDFSKRIGDRFVALSPTQKRIVSFLYRMIRASEISVDDLFEKFNHKYEKKISNPAEMYYRLAVLTHLGFIKLRTIGEHTTMVVTQSDVGAVLLNGDLLDS